MLEETKFMSWTTNWQEQIDRLQDGKQSNDLCCSTSGTLEYTFNYVDQN